MFKSLRVTKWPIDLNHFQKIIIIFTQKLNEDEIELFPRNRKNWSGNKFPEISWIITRLSNINEVNVTNQLLYKLICDSTISFLKGLDFFLLEINPPKD